MKTTTLSDNELDSLTAILLKEWKDDGLHHLMASSIWAVVENGRSLELVISPMCLTIRMWIDGQLKRHGYPAVNSETQNAITVSMLERVFASALKMK